VKILVRATNWIGDAVMSLPALRAIRDRYPDSRISVLARPWVSALYDGESCIDELISLEGAAGPRDWLTKWRLAAGLRSRDFDLSLLFPNSFESAAVVRLAGAKRRIGYARDGRSPLLTDAISVPAKNDIPRHERYYYLELLRRAGIIDTLPDVPAIRFEQSEAAAARGRKLFESLGIGLPVIGVSPGAAYGSAKRWLPERFAETAASLAADRHASIAIFGSAAEKDLCEQVAIAAKGTNLAARTTLREFIDLTAACDLYLTNDSGAMHVASALGVPSVTVFGPTDEFATGPTGPLARIIREPVDCAPCLLRECPIDHRCMTRVTSSAVIATAREVLGAGS
jgi:heptosyltransferase II